MQDVLVTFFADCVMMLCFTIITSQHLLSVNFGAGIAMAYIFSACL